MHFAWYGPNTPERAFGYRVIGDGFVIELGSVDAAAQHLHTIYHDLGNVLGRTGQGWVRRRASAPQPQAAAPRRCKADDAGASRPTGNGRHRPGFRLRSIRATIQGRFAER